MNQKKNVLKERSFQFSLNVISFFKQLPNSAIYWKLSDQLLRSGTSIGANIHEAISSSSKKEFIRYYEISLKSANETVYWLELFEQANLADKDKITPLLNEAQELARMLASSIKTMKRSL